MNPQNSQQPPQAYGTGAQNRAMLASTPLRQPYTNTSPNNIQPMGLQAGDQQVARSQIVQSNMNQQQALIQQQMAAQTANANYVNAPNPEAPQAIGSAPTEQKIVELPISTQATLLISEIRDGIVIMKDGSFRAVVACQSINFDLMSETEREGVEYSYQNFLNSLNFTIQILIRSQRVDITPYLDRLTNIRRNNDNMLLGILMDDYINFIDRLAQEANIMDKSFFIVIPYYSSADAETLASQTRNLFRGFSKQAPEVTRINRDTYNKAIDELNNRVESVVSGLFQIGIQSVRLNSRELNELYYNFNNPDTAVREPLVDFSKLATTYVKKGDKQNG